VQTISLMSDKETKFKITHKYGLTLSEQEPEYFIKVIREQNLTDDDKEKLSAILL